MDETVSQRTERRGKDPADSCVCNCPLHLWVRHFTEVSLAFPKCALCGMLIV